MNVHPRLSILQAVAVFASVSNPAPGANVRSDYAAFDGGGGVAHSANYGMQASLPGFVGSVATGARCVFRLGFLGQINDPPRVGTDLLSRRSVLSAKVRIRTLLENDIDPEGGALTFLGIGKPGMSGALTAADETWVFYDPVNVTASDQFYYAVADPEGDISLGLISVSVLPPGYQPTHNLLGLTPLANGEIRVDFVGIPRRWYRIEHSDSVSTPKWELLARLEAGADGVFAFTDVNGGSTRFYRAIGE